MKERLQKLLSERGVCSRRAAEQLIEQGRVFINGKAASLGDGADPELDQVSLDGKPIISVMKKRYIMLNKPRGYVTTMKDDQGRPNVIALLTGVTDRVYPVGRLDLFSEGLLLLTNDGELTYRLTHPSHQVYKEYLVKINIPKDHPDIPPEVALAAPLELDGRPLAPVICRRVATTDEGCIITLSIREGRNRQIRRMCRLCGYTASSLKRVAVGRLRLGDLPSGEWRDLTQEEVAYLLTL